MTRRRQTRSGRAAFRPSPRAVPAVGRVCFGHRAPRTACRRPAYLLVELVIAIGVVSLVVAVLGKLLTDGIYLQRVAGQHANHLALISALRGRLHTDALGAVAYSWDERPDGPALSLVTFADGQEEHVRWTFLREAAMRCVDGRDAGGFAAERLEFSARVEPGARCDTLVAELIIPPAARGLHKNPHVYCVHVPLPASVDVSGRNTSDDGTGAKAAGGGQEVAGDK